MIYCSETVNLVKNSMDSDVHGGNGIVSMNTGIRKVQYRKRK